MLRQHRGGMPSDLMLLVVERVVDDCALLGIWMRALLSLIVFSQ
jgi:hypothetical protein